MARRISGSNSVGRTGSKAEAEERLQQLIGDLDRDFAQNVGCNYWNYLKQMVVRYAQARQLEGEFVVKGSPFNWQDTISSRCYAVLLRKDYHRGEHLIEPELFVEVGVITDPSGTAYAGAACGFHYLEGSDGDASHFVRKVLEDRELNAAALRLANNGFRSIPNGGPALLKNGVLEWSSRSVIGNAFLEKDVPTDLEAQVRATFDDLLPFYRGVVAPRAQ